MYNSTGCDYRWRSYSYYYRDATCQLTRRKKTSLLCYTPRAEKHYWALSKCLLLQQALC
jgi:hypothetical protein